jgi:hypothetical protein
MLGGFAHQRESKRTEADMKRRTRVALWNSLDVADGAVGDPPQLQVIPFADGPQAQEYLHEKTLCGSLGRRLERSFLWAFMEPGGSGEDRHGPGQ